MEEEEGEVKEGDGTSWAEVFSRLDKGDGDEDGRIACRDFIEWIDTLSFQDSISLEVVLCYFHDANVFIGAQWPLSRRAEVDGSCS